MTQEEVNSILERPKPNSDAANNRNAELEAALATIESEVFELPCQSCGLSSECSAHDLISRIEAAIKRVKGGEG